MTSNLLPEQLETPRLLIRVARPGDGPVFNAAVLESLAELSPWLGWVTPPPTLEASELNCRRAYARCLLNEDLMVFFFLKRSGELVGGSGLHGADWTLRRFEVGYWGRTAFAGQGLMTEGVRALADHALQHLGAHRVFLTVDDQNVRSWRLAERAGFALEGVLVNERFNLQGQLRRTRVYARTSAQQPPLDPPPAARPEAASSGGVAVTIPPLAAAPQGCVVFAKNKRRVSAFYQQTLGLELVESEPSHDLLRARGCELVIHAIPRKVASDIRIARPVQPRQDTPIKPTFVVPDLAAVRAAAERTGGHLKPLEGAWHFRGCTVLDGWDPEGNVVQFKQPD